MRISQLAELAGTTPRTVRHYHAVGLLPVPDEVGGWRDYDVTHLARLSRVRWLADAGLSLPDIAAALDGPGSPREDLAAVLAGIDERLADLGEQRARLARILDAVEATEALGVPALSPMPPRVVAFYGQLLDKAPDEPTARAIRRERDFAEAAYIRGEMPEAVELLYDIAQTEELEESLRAYSRIAENADSDEARELARAAVDRMLRKLGDQVGEVVAALHTEQIVRLFDLYLTSADEDEARIGAMTREVLLEEIAARKEGTR